MVLLGDRNPHGHGIILQDGDEGRALARHVPLVGVDLHDLSLQGRGDTSFVEPELLTSVGGPTDVGALGLTEDDRAEVVRSGHYLRAQFTVRRLIGVLFTDDAFLV